MSATERADRAEALRRFKPYLTYKDSGVEWLGEIPAGWAVKKWRYCCRVTEGQVAPDDDRFRDRVMIAPNHIESGTGRILYTETADEQGAISGKYLVRPGDIIYSKIRPALNKVCIATGDWLCSADMYPVVITEENLHARFLLYYILSEPFVRLMVDESMRVAMPKVNREKLANCPLAIPSPIEQDTIAAFLDRETARIDALVAKKERLVELLQEQRTALITRAVTKGLDPTVPMKDSGVEWLGEIPAQWTAKRIRQSCSRVTDGAHISPDTSSGDFPFVSTVDIRGGAIDFDGCLRTSAASYVYMERTGCRPKDGDVLFSKDGTVGTTTVVTTDREFAVASSLVILSPDQAEVDAGWLDYWLNGVFIKDQVELLLSGAALRRISVAKVGRLPILVPPELDEQRAIATFLDRETARIDALVAKVRDAIDRLKELRTALISAAVTGKIDVREEIA